MRRALEIEASERIVLECGCGERLVLLGREDDWYAEGRDAFECACGERLTLADRVERGSGVVGLIRGRGFLEGRGRAGTTAGVLRSGRTREANPRA